MKHLIILVTVILGASTIHAASFNCSKASTIIEKAICSDEEISELDSLLGKAYKKAMGGTSNKNQLKSEQRDWLANTRNKCTDLLCLKKVYERRISELEMDVPLVIEDDLDAQIAEFFQPPSQEQTRGDWTVLGPVKGEYYTYMRVISRAPNCRMGCNLLLLDFNTERPDIPYINIAVGVLSSVKEVMETTYMMYNIFVDGRKVSRIKFNTRASKQGGYVFLEYNTCGAIKNVYSKMLNGKQITFLSDDKMSEFEFGINDLSSAENLFK